MKSVFKVSLEIRFDRDKAKPSKMVSIKKRIGIKELITKRYSEVKGTSEHQID